MRIFIVGGGQSLEDFDWSFLHDRATIAVTNSFKKLPNAAYIYFSDIRFWNWQRAGLLAHKAAKITTAKIPKNITSVARYKVSCVKNKAIDFRKGYLKLGNSSGYAAINLAVHLGATEIFLLGYDMHADTGKNHWHSDYPIKNKSHIYARNMLKFFDAAAKELAGAGIKVINFGETSKIECFAKLKLEAVYDY